MDTNYYVYSKTGWKEISTSREAINRLLELSDTDEVMCMHKTNGLPYNDDGGCFTCTRKKGHSGPHMAHGLFEFCAIWPKEV